MDKMAVKVEFETQTDLPVFTGFLRSFFTGFSNGFLNHKMDLLVRRLWAKTPRLVNRVGNGPEQGYFNLLFQCAWLVGGRNAVRSASALLSLKKIVVYGHLSCGCAHTLNEK